MGSHEKQRFGRHFLICCAMLLAGVGCSTNTLNIDESVPRPLVASQPVGVGVHYSDAFRNYRFEEGLAKDRRSWLIDLGPAHVQLFDRLLQAMFAKVVAVKNPGKGSGKQAVRVVIQPSIDEVSLDTPWDSETDFYDVTIHYSLTFFSPAGQLMTRWSFFGHGRARSAFFSDDEPVQKAVLAAMRDAAALLAVELGDRPEVNGTLQANQEQYDRQTEDNDS